MHIIFCFVPQFCVSPPDSGLSFFFFYKVHLLNATMMQRNSLNPTRYIAAVLCVWSQSVLYGHGPTTTVYAAPCRRLPVISQLVVFMGGLVCSVYGLNSVRCVGGRSVRPRQSSRGGTTVSSLKSSHDCTTLYAALCHRHAMEQSEWGLRSVWFAQPKVSRGSVSTRVQ